MGYLFTKSDLSNSLICNEWQNYAFLPTSIELVHLLASSVGTSEPFSLQPSNFRFFACSRGLNYKNKSNKIQLCRWYPLKITETVSYRIVSTTILPTDDQTREFWNLSILCRTTWAQRIPTFKWSTTPHTILIWVSNKKKKIINYIASLQHKIKTYQFNVLQLLHYFFSFQLLAHD